MPPPQAPLRIVFAGTPDFAAAHLNALLQRAEHEVIAAYCQPDRPAGRGKKQQAGPVKQCALDAGLPVYQPLNFRDVADREALAALEPDLMVVVAYGLLLPPSVLAIPRLGCVNVHASLLPRWRGAAPIQRAIEAGDTSTGITIMQMDKGLDTGDMLVVRSCDIAATDTAASLHDKLAVLGSDALREALELLAEGRAQPQKQDDSQSCYARKIDKSEAEIDWSLNAALLERRIRAFNPVPVCYSWLGQERIKIWRATVGDAVRAAPGDIVAAASGGIQVACGEGSLLLQQLQLPGGRVLDAADLLNARASRFGPGTRLGRGE